MYEVVRGAIQEMIPRVSTGGGRLKSLSRVVERNEPMIVLLGMKNSS